MRYPVTPARSESVHIRTACVVLRLQHSVALRSSPVNIRRECCVFFAELKLDVSGIGLLLICGTLMCEFLLVVFEVCELAYLSNHMSKLTKSSVLLPVAEARSSCICIIACMCNIVTR